MKRYLLQISVISLAFPVLSDAAQTLLQNRPDPRFQGLDFADYVATANDNLAVIVQAEHIDAINNIEEIAAVEGLDAIFIGPYDLSTSMNRTGEVNHDEVVAAIDRVTRACQHNNLGLGYFGVTVESVLPYIDKGYRLICTGVDAGFITSSAAEIAESIAAVEIS